MDLHKSLSFPNSSGEIVQQYQKGKLYDAFTIDNTLEIIKCKGFIESNGHYNYHNNYDSSEDVLMISVPNRSHREQWFTLDINEAKKVQQNLINEWKVSLNTEISRINQLIKHGIPTKLYHFNGEYVEEWYINNTKPLLQTTRLIYKFKDRLEEKGFIDTENNVLIFDDYYGCVTALKMAEIKIITNEVIELENQHNKIKHQITKISTKYDCLRNSLQNK